MIQGVALSLVDDNLCPCETHHLGIAHDVVYMGMGIEDGSNLHTVLVGELDQLLGLICGVDNQGLTSLLITGGFQLKEKGLSGWEQIEKWWTNAPNFSFPIHVTEGSAVFKADGVVKVTPFQATFP